MSNRELPMMPWFPKEFAASTSTWSFAERSAYRALLDVQWEIGVLPTETWRLAQAVGLPLAEFELLWPVVGKKFRPVDGGILNFRLEEYRLTSMEMKQSRRAGAEITNAKRAAERNADRTAERHAERPANRIAERSAERRVSATPPSPSPSISKNSPNPHAQGGAGAPERVNANGDAKTPRQNGTHPRALGTNPRAKAKRKVAELVTGLSRKLSAKH